MPCTTLLVGKNASYDGSTLIARNDDSQSTRFTPKKLAVIHPEQQNRVYETVLSHLKIQLPDHPMRYTAMPNALNGEGIWAASGINEAEVAMTATETITSNPRVLGADPLVEYDEETNTPGGIGEEDIVYLVLPYIHSAREGVLRLGSLLEKYGTYEMNGIAFSDHDEIWWLETIGGHHWIARRVPDDAYVVMPNQLGIDTFDLKDAFTTKENHLCSDDLKEFIEKNHLCLNLDDSFNARYAFGSHDDSDHVYNTPRDWFIRRYLNPHTYKWDGEDADFTPFSDDIPWTMVPERKITVEDVKYALSTHFQNTPYDPYITRGDLSNKGALRPVGINRNDFLSVLQVRQGQEPIEWFTFGSNVFNTLVPLYIHIDTVPEYYSNTTGEVSTDNFYWANRLIGAMADACDKQSAIHIERYQRVVQSHSHHIIHTYDELIENETDEVRKTELRHEANQKAADMLKKETSKTLHLVLDELSFTMKNKFARSDA